MAFAVESDNPKPQPISSIYLDCEDVFASRSDRLPDAPVRTFGDHRWDANTVVPRRPNMATHKLVIVFPEHPAWSLRSREVAMTLLNPRDPRLAERSISFGSIEFSIGHVLTRCASYKIAAAWQMANSLPDDISAWRRQDWAAMVEHAIAENRSKGSVRHLISAIRDLVSLSAVLTGGGIDSDPWNGISSTVIAKTATAGTTQVVAPSRWIPLMDACWTYIDTFAADILSLRHTHQCHKRVPLRERQSRKYLSYGALLEEFLSRPDSVVPMRRTSTGDLEPHWPRLSRLITAGQVPGLFRTRPQRRQSVQEAVAQGKLISRVLSASEFEDLMRTRAATDPLPEGAKAISPASHYDALIGAWIADSENKVAVYDTTVTDLTESDINWAMMDRIVLRTGGLNVLFTGRYSTAERRRRTMLQVARSGRIFEAKNGLLGTPRKCTEFVLMQGPDGQLRPWREVMSDFEARCELRALRAACYVFIAAMTMMRDSEIQDLQRGCISDFYGVPAVKSNVYKGRSTSQTAHWWIVDEVVTAIAVLEQLSVHPQYLFASYVEGPYENPEPGISARGEIDYLLQHLAETGARSGLPSIPPGPAISPRALRRTTACISRELGGNELAVSHQLKHAIDYGWANVTAAYMARDPVWADFLQTNRSEQNLEHMVTMIRESARQGQQLAGRGGERLTQALISSATPESGTDLQAIALSDPEVTALLKKVAPEIHFGPANACLYDAQSALCQRHANTDADGPILGLCQPARCHNAVIGAEHLPVWISELGMLTKTLAAQKLSPPRRKALTDRLADVEHVLSQAEAHSQERP